MSASFMAGPSSGSAAVSPTGTKPQMRKRTKTGCLTCRKRRIKCGEERPTCANCIKSKRQCEGYNPPIKWQNQQNPMNFMTPMQFHSSMLPGSRPEYGHTQPSPHSQEFQRPATQHEYANVGTAPVRAVEYTQQTVSGVASVYADDSSYFHHQPLHTPQSDRRAPTSAAGSYHASQAPPTHAHFSVHYGQGLSMDYSPQQPFTQAVHHHQARVSHPSQIDPSLTPSQHHPGSAYDHSQRRDYGRYSGQVPFHDSNPGRRTHVDFNGGGQYPYYAATGGTLPPVQIPQPDSNPDVEFLPQHAPAIEQTDTVAQPQEQLQPELHLGGLGGIDHASPTQLLDEAAVECEDDDYYDVQSDEEVLDEPHDGMVKGTHPDFSLIQRIHRESIGHSDIRRFDSFIYEGILTSYRPEQVASPLKNPKTARVFMHFIHVTGPTLSIYERNPRNPALLYGGQLPPPPSQQSLWTYTLPQQALNNQGLLHAMLALSSVHIAKLQNASVTPSWKHYAYSLKQLGRALTDPNKRLQIPTLATALLLAYYEVMTAEMVKWSTHLAGATQLIAELDFRTLTQHARQFVASQTAQAEKALPLQQKTVIGQEHPRDTPVPDENLVSTIAGYKVRYDDFGVVLEDRHQRKRTNAGKFDLQSHETLQDLYWWHCRQDMIQSIVSGNPLVMPYRKWSDCPPRAPLGRIDALYGSHDHIILLIARIADFIVRDRERKIKQVEANGGHWIPTPGVPGLGAMGPPPTHAQGPRGPPSIPSVPMGPPPHMQTMGPPPGWKGPPPPGWRGGPPPGFQSPPPSASQGPASATQGHPSGWTGPPPPGRKGPPPSSGLPAQSPNFPGPANQSQGSTPQETRGPSASAAGPGFYGMAPSRPPGPLPSSYANPNRSASKSPPDPPGDSHAQFSDLAAAYQAALEEWNSISHAHATVASLLSSNPAFAPLTADLYPATTPGGTPATTPFGPALIYRSYDISILWTLLHLAQILLLRSHPGMPPAAMVAAAVGAAATQPYAMLIGRIVAGLPLSPSFPASSLGSSTEQAPALTPALGAAHIESCISLFFAGVQYQDPAQREWLITRLLEIDKRTGWASANVIARSCETAWEKAGEAGRGPPYVERRTRRFGEEAGGAGQRKGKGEERAGHKGGSGQLLRERGQQQHHHKPQKPPDIHHAEEWDEGERRYVVRHRAGFVPWAMNLLADERDIRVRMESVALVDNEESGKTREDGGP
ncbi:uncharacterized protein EI97DRAFT_267708 [Westerdykella ornata]|uniref:Zn(2)-C6 fungal-type domain-containing protein n=1 Tax=Westerdykella ornata TaxID=318751 RepID=A0A6A6J5U4_WESOR|nr:uncharacterized protein EI97DRAFT_267708 [Westerdykella ornata]KAF2271503.1 hypothetical protein EI97DRAFT_267708 [Westerdykella ornata]